MTSGSYLAATTFARAAVERALAHWQRRASLVSGDELVRLAEQAFPGDDAKHAAVDAIAHRAAMDAGGATWPDATRGIAHSLSIDEQCLASGMSIDLTRAIRQYADSQAALIVQREATVRETRAATVQTRAGDAPWLTDGGVWQSGATHRRGAVVTHGGALWVAQVEGASDRPGSSSEWRLMAKTTQGSR